MNSNETKTSIIDFTRKHENATRGMYDDALEFEHNVYQEAVRRYLKFALADYVACERENTGKAFRDAYKTMLDEMQAFTEYQPGTDDDSFEELVSYAKSLWERIPELPTDEEKYARHLS